MTISVIIPVYNADKKLEACVASVMRQVFPPAEILLVDDGSPEGTALAERLEREISCLRLIRQEHDGASQARNRGLGEATGDWILLLDADDTLTAGAFEAFEKGISEDTDACCGRILRGTEAAPEKTSEEKSLQLSGSELMNRALAAPTDLLTIHGWIFRREVCRDIWFNSDLCLGEDSEWVLRVLENCKRAVLIGQPVYRYTITPDSAVHGWKPGQAESYLKMLETVGQTKAAREKNWPLFVLTQLLLILTHDTFHPANPGSRAEQIREAKRIREVPVFRDALQNADYSLLDPAKRMTLKCMQKGWIAPVWAAVRIRQKQNARRM